MYRDLAFGTIKATIVVIVIIALGFIPLTITAITSNAWFLLSYIVTFPILRICVNEIYKLKID